MTEASTSDGSARPNSQLQIPSDKGAAVNFTYQRLQNLQTQRKWCADRQRDILNAAKKKGIIPASVREAMRLERMTPERREKYFEQRKAAFEMFGFKVEPADETAEVTTLNGIVAELKLVAGEKKDITDEIREVSQAANAAGVNVAVLKDLLRIGKRDPEDRAEYFGQMDMLGTFLKFW